MLKNISRARVIGIWVATVLTIAVCGIAAGAPMTIGTAELFLVGCLVPPAVMLLIWRGAPPLTVAELLHSVDEPGNTP